MVHIVQRRLIRVRRWETLLGLDWLTCPDHLSSFSVLCWICLAQSSLLCNVLLTFVCISVRFRSAIVFVCHCFPALVFACRCCPALVFNCRFRSVIAFACRLIFSIFFYVVAASFIHGQLKLPPCRKSDKLYHIKLIRVQFVTKYGIIYVCWNFITLHYSIIVYKFILY